MRLVAVADTHLLQDELDVPPGDVFVHAGDLCRSGALHELEAALAWIHALPHPHKVVVAGNHDWAFNLERGAALAERWAHIPPGLDVLVTHGPPAGFGDRSSVTGRQGCAELLARVRCVRPRLHLFGHIHEDRGAWREDETTFVNCTTWECEQPAAVIDIDPATGAVCVVEPRGS